MFLYLLLFLNIFCAVNQIIAVGDPKDSKLFNDQSLKPLAMQMYTHRTFNGTRSYLFPPSVFKQDHGELKKDQPVLNKTEEPKSEVVPAILEVPEAPVNKEIKPEKQTLNTDSAEKMTLRSSNKTAQSSVEKMTLRSDGKPSIVKYLSIKKNKTKKNSKKKCPYSDCGKKYGQPYFNTHLESHEGAFKCEYCEDFFASGIVLKRHKKVCCCR